MLRKTKAIWLFAIILAIAGSGKLNSFERENSKEYLENIHAHLKLVYGTLNEEYPEQLMTARFLPKEAKVLELGGNIGRNSCVIASILQNSTQLVSLETNPKDARCLRYNRNINDLDFHIENAALSKRSLIQRGWTTVPSESVLPGYFRVKTISFANLQSKYGIIFDTIIADCEGAVYYILKDDPDLLKNIKLIIIENDFTDYDEYQYVKGVFEVEGFSLVYNQSGGSGPCYNWFYQVWRRL